ncbi:hypothetical protein V8E55_006050 [Tylopilus felleus]
MTSCQRCGEAHSGPAAFLLTCRGCRRSWHHRCAMPAVEDDHLIQLIRATNAGDTANGLGSWMCRRCKKATSATPSSTSSREPKASPESREDNKNTTSSRNSLATPSTASNIASTADVRVKQESSTVAVHTRPANDKKSDGPESAEPSVQRTYGVKRTKPSVASQPHVEPQSSPTQPQRDTDVEMRDVAPAESILQEKTRFPQRPSSATQTHQVKAARKLSNTVSATSTEDDVEMQVDPFTSSESTSRASKTPFSIRGKSIAEAPPHARAASSTDERGREVRPADNRPQANQVVAAEVDDDPEDLYGPPVERRIIRILPSLAEELREQQRRVAAEKDKRLGRAPLAPDWIYARHVNDPLWKEVPTQGRKQRKGTARKLGDNGLNVNELLGCYTVQNWVREHKS